MTERVISRRDVLKGAVELTKVGLVAAGGATVLEVVDIFIQPLADKSRKAPTTSQAFQLTPPPASIESSQAPNISSSPEATPNPTVKPTLKPTPEPKPTPRTTPKIWIKYQGPQVVWNGNKAKKDVYLTMDDGWNPSNMEKALKIANDNGIKMTFCPIGKLIAANPGMYQEIIAEGHDVQNHTFTHSRLDTKTKDQIRTEVLKARDALWKAAGVEYPQHFLRPPGEYGVTGISVYKPLFDATKELGYRVLVWDVSSAGTSYGAYSATPAQVEQVRKNVVNHMHNGAISLQHAINVDVAAFPAIVSEVKRKGFNPITVRQGLG